MKDFDNFENLAISIQSLLLDICSLEKNQLWENIFSRKGGSFKEEIVTKLENIKNNLDNYELRLSQFSKMPIKGMQVWELNKYLTMLSDFGELYRQAQSAISNIVKNCIDKKEREELLTVLLRSKKLVNKYLELVRYQLKNNLSFVNLQNKLKIDFVEKYHLGVVE